VLRAFNRGGNYNNTANGFASFNGNNARSNANGNIGFRAALPPWYHSASRQFDIQPIVADRRRVSDAVRLMP